MAFTAEVRSPLLFVNLQVADLLNTQDFSSDDSDCGYRRVLGRMLSIQLLNGHYREPELGLFLLGSHGAMPQGPLCETTLGTALSYHYHAHIQHLVLF